jgi:hypothetical protein
MEKTKSNECFIVNVLIMYENITLLIESKIHTKESQENCLLYLTGMFGNFAPVFMKVSKTCLQMVV